MRASSNTGVRVSSTALSVFLFLSAITFGLSIYMLVLTSINYGQNTQQDRTDLLIFDRIENFTVKDMALMDKDAQIQAMLNDLDNRITQNTQDRISKDMILMDNFMQLLDTLDQDRHNRITKDMVLMDNTTYSFMVLEMLEEFDMEAIEIFMDKFGNCTSLNMRLDEEIVERVAKDIILMENVTHIESSVSVLESNFEDLKETVDPQLLDLQDKDMQLMQNATNLFGLLENETSTRITADELIDYDLTQIELKLIVLLNNITSLQERVDTLIEIYQNAIRTINGEPPNGVFDFTLIGTSNLYGNRINVNPVANGVDISFDFFTGPLEPRIIYIFFKGASALPSASHPIPLGTETTGAFFAGTVYPPPGSGLTSQFDPHEQIGLDCPSGGPGGFFPSCNTFTVLDCDDNGANCVYPNIVPYRTNAIKLVGQGAFMVTITMRMGFRQDGGADQTTGIYLGLRYTGVGPGLVLPPRLLDCAADVLPSDEQPRHPCLYTTRGNWAPYNHYSSGLPPIGDTNAGDAVFYGQSWYVALQSHISTPTTHPLSAAGMGNVKGMGLWDDIRFYDMFLLNPGDTIVSPPLPGGGGGSVSDPPPPPQPGSDPFQFYLVGSGQPCENDDYEDDRPITLECTRMVYHDSPLQTTFMQAGVYGWDAMSNPQRSGGPIRYSYLEFRVEATKVF